jgi:hypothetical protein
MTGSAPIVNTKELPFLDPLEPTSIRVGSLTYPSVESLFLASHFEDQEIRDKFAECTGQEARALYTKLLQVHAKRRPDFREKTVDKGHGSVPGYVELLRRAWFLRFVQHAAELQAFLGTDYRPFMLKLTSESAAKANDFWVSDEYANEILTVVRAQLRDLSPSQLAMIQAGKDPSELGLEGVGGPGDSNVPANGEQASEPEAAPYLD